MTLVPIVFTSISLGVAGIGDMKTLGRLGGRTFGYFALYTLIAATIGLTSLEVAATAQASSESGRAEMAPVLEVRPYQLMCILCRLGEGRDKDLGDARLNEILAAVRKDVKTPIQQCNFADCTCDKLTLPCPSCCVVQAK